MTVKHWLITFDCALMFRKKVSFIWSAFTAMITLIRILNLFFTLVLCSVDIEISMRCSFFLIVRQQICKYYWDCSLTWYNHLHSDFFLNSDNMSHLILLLSIRKMNLTSHQHYSVVHTVHALLIFDCWSEIFDEKCFSYKYLFWLSSWL